MTLRFLTLLIAFISVALPSIEPVAAQTASLSSTVDPTGSYSLGPGQEDTFRWTINAVGAGAAAVTVTPSLTVPPGWNVQADLASFTLGGPNGQTARTLDVRIGLPPEATDIVSGALKLRADGTSAAGAAAPTEQTVFLTYVAPVVPPAPIPPDYTWALATGIGILVLLVALAIYFVQARRIGIVVDNPIKRFNIGTGGAYKVTVANPRNIPQNVQLRVTDLPKDWSAAFSFPVVPLNGGERSEVPLWVNVPSEAAPNMRQGFRIQARPNRFSPWLITRKLEVTTLDVVIQPKNG